MFYMRQELLPFSSTWDHSPVDVLYEAGTASVLKHLGSSPVDVLYEAGTASLLKHLGSSPVLLVSV
jgi:hypothetical protein